MASSYQRLGEAPIRTPYHLSARDVFNAAANQLLYSQAYSYFYISLGVLSLISLIVALSEKCPSTGFIVLESIVCLAMTVEVATRILALGKIYWASVLNVVDIFLVFLCVLLLFLLSSGCSAASSSEEVFNTIVLLIRNCVQIARVAMMIRQNQRHMDARDVTIQFTQGGGDDLEELGGESSFYGGYSPTSGNNRHSPSGLQEIIAIDDGYESAEASSQTSRGFTTASRYHNSPALGPSASTTSLAGNRKP